MVTQGKFTGLSDTPMVVFIPREGRTINLHTDNVSQEDMTKL